MRRKRRPADPEDAHAARERCLRLLSLRSRSTAELRERLARAGYGEGVTEQVLADLSEAGLLDDEEFARAWVASRQVAGGAGRQKLRWELRRKGVSQDVIRREVDEAITDEMELEQGLRLARRRMAGRPAEAEALRRVRRLLLGRGFGFDTVEQVLRRLTREAEF